MSGWGECDIIEDMRGDGRNEKTKKPVRVYIDRESERLEWTDIRQCWEMIQEMKPDPCDATT